MYLYMCVVDQKTQLSTSHKKFIHKFNPKMFKPQKSAVSAAGQVFSSLDKPD